MHSTYKVALMSLFFTLNLQAQLSPGKLTQTHASLEGLAQCSTCHSLGSTDFRAKCLGCHKALAERISLKKGLHAGADFQRCQSCHSDHHGLDYELIHWPQGQAAFDHGQTGYRLEGAHKRLQCKDCHQEKNQAQTLTNQQGLNPKHSFLGLAPDCLGCHEDTHRNQLGTDCLNCHTMSGWQGAKNFDHDKADFALKGAHLKLDCVACHPKPSRAGATDAVRRFKPVAHGQCGDCHKDVHQASLGERCVSCHTLDRFKPAPLFDHAQTQFPLKGRHVAVSCEGCHPKSSDPALVLFTHKAQASANNCQSCHKDPHENRLGSDCASCHTPDDWRRMGKQKFDHRRTRFPLLAKHADVACSKCHGAGFKTKGFEDCASCHKDVHQGQFKDVAGSCASCHDEHGFQPSRFTLARHQRTRFPLEGAHLASPCFACHESVTPKGAARYHFESMTCETCHKDVHQGEANAFMKHKGDCGTCHGNSSWQELKFDHAQTSFPLVGAHQSATCGSCHKALAGKGPSLSGLPKTCSSCHQDVHQGQFAVAGKTDCGACHEPQTWQKLSFDHGRTRFPLEGAHLAVACKACHQPVHLDDQRYIRYKPLEPACAACHAAITPPP